MTAYVEKSISKGERADSAAKEVLTMKNSKTGERRQIELRHGEWIDRARAKLKIRRFGTPQFALIVVFAVLFVGSVYLLEHLDILLCHGSMSDTARTSLAGIVAAATTNPEYRAKGAALALLTAPDCAVHE